MDPEAAAALEDENNHMLACTVVSVAARSGIIVLCSRHHKTHIADPAAVQAS